MYGFYFKNEIAGLSRAGDDDEGVHAVRDCCGTGMASRTRTDVLLDQRVQNVQKADQNGEYQVRCFSFLVCFKKFEKLEHES